MAVAKQASTKQATKTNTAINFPSNHPGINHNLLDLMKNASADEASDEIKCSPPKKNPCGTGDAVIS
jgi:hypothetical protein